MMDFPLSCECGTTHTVSGGLAGTTFECGCGRELKIPSLKTLRETAGLTGVEISPEDQVRSLVDEGRLPGPDCVSCGLPADNVIPLVADCEQQFALHSGSQFWVRLLGVWFAPLWALTRRAAETVEIHGRDTVVPVPIAMCGTCHRFAFPRGDGSGLLALSWILLLIATPLLFVKWPIGLRVAGAAAASHVAGLARGQLNQRSLRTFLSKVPSYRDLLKKFPSARIARRG